ncbi:uncharacterized protein Nmag_2739 [Natrialba magadii ATCC 43099]|uniref:Uncharacterized protein n=1 Tax=Natrialba magadii (strain ATCC 43099 / DSM 3394 / CCM 3739 / CIP 104546 / IAM 13178 / JCM 8861 / NBRC 102185 / NCIMB 2190 / MS3) TaxID=547559 RepID=D3SZN5_NATMM|nr:hypothetical protein [Natrialba magadii]ADD06295.1 uncharacterized protein Nmag_2739 [Natrialba magadii ATCC 43099]ELY31268.1 hypothetical protein C500_06691 [Natrialba magadii ATCC 43099]
MPSDRRTFLTICGTGATTALAGCADARVSARDVVTPHDPIEASLGSKRVFGVRNDHAYELFDARPFADEDLPLEENDAPVVFPQRIEPETYPGIPDGAHVAPMVPDEIVISPVYEETLEDGAEYSTPEPPLTVESVVTDRLSESFDEFVFDGRVTLADRDDAASSDSSMPFLAGDTTSYRLSQEAFSDLKIGDLFRFRPSYSQPEYVSEVLERWTAY